MAFSVADRVQVAAVIQALIPAEKAVAEQGMEVPVEAEPQPCTSRILKGRSGPWPWPAEAEEHVYAPEAETGEAVAEYRRAGAVPTETEQLCIAPAG